METNNDLLVQFARLQGQTEAMTNSAMDEDIADVLKSYDSIDVLETLTKWVDEYLLSDYDDSYEFFTHKVNTLL